MSIKTMTRVWEHSKQESSALLLLLALADFADDDGFCWPDEPTLAKKSRGSVRNTRRLLIKLEAEQEIVRRPGKGRGHNTEYLVLSGLSAQQKEDKLSSFKSAKEDNQGTQKRTTRVKNNRPKTSTATKQTTKLVGGDPSLDPSLNTNTSIPPKVASAPPADSKKAVAPKASKPKSQPRDSQKQPHKDQCLKDAIALNWQGISPAEATGYTGQLSARVGQVWKRKLGIEVLTAEQYQKTARSIPRFVEWIDDNHPNVRDKLRSLDKFEDYYREFMSGSSKPKAPRPMFELIPDSADSSTWLDPKDMVGAA